MVGGLNLKQEAFVSGYIGEANGNATEAARLAGYRGSDDTLAVTGSRLLSNAKIERAVAQYRASIKARGIAARENRIAEYNARWDALLTVRQQRAADEETVRLPGGATGLIVKQLKNVKHTYDGDPNDPDDRGSVMVIETWEAALDTGYLREMRELEKHAAQDLGQWEEKTTATHDATGDFLAALRSFAGAA